MSSTEKAALAKLDKMIRELEDIHSFHLTWFGGEDRQPAVLFGAREPHRLDASTRFPFGCLVKILIGAYVTDLHFSKPKTLNLDESIAKLLQIETSAPLSHIPFDAITVKHLLNHTSGIDDSFYSWPRGEQGLDGILSDISRRGLLFDPGSQVSYCNLGYLLLCLLIEKRVGKDWLQCINEHFGTSISHTNELALSPAPPAISRGTARNSVIPPMVNGANLYIDAVDMARILNYLIELDLNPSGKKQLQWLVGTDDAGRQGGNGLGGFGWYRIGQHAFLQTTGARSFKNTIILDTMKGCAVGLLANGPALRANELLIGYVVGGPITKFVAVTETPACTVKELCVGCYSGNGYKFTFTLDSQENPIVHYEDPHAAEPLAHAQLKPISPNTLMILGHGWGLASRIISFHLQGEHRPYIRIGNLVFVRRG